MTKITLYSPKGGSIEIDDTPRRREWAKGKGYHLEVPPESVALPPTAAPEPEPEDFDEE